MRAVLCLGLAFLLFALSCGGNDREEILVFVAASLTDVMDRLGEEFSANEGVNVNFNLGGSTTLAQQIIRGAPADAFISAGAHPMDKLVARGLVSPDTGVELLTNRLVLVGLPNAAGELGITSLEGLANADVRVAIADPDLAPAGSYAREALENLGLWRRLEPRIVPSSDVRVALGYVKTGNVDAGIVYLTDARNDRDLRILGVVPSESHSPIVYPAAVIADSRHEASARKFLLFLQSQEAQETFAEFGFTPQGGL